MIILKNMICISIFRRALFQRMAHLQVLPWRQLCFLLLQDVRYLAKVAMTGEITLRGRVLPIGGLKEKILAAKMAHIKKVLVPDKNRPDMAELSKEITRGSGDRLC